MQFYEKCILKSQLDAPNHVNLLSVQKAPQIKKNGDSLITLFIISTVLNTKIYLSLYRESVSLQQLDV